MYFLNSVILWTLNIIERNEKTYLSWSKTQWKFHKSRHNKPKWSRLWLARKMREAAGRRFFPLFFLYHLQVKWKRFWIKKLHVRKKASFYLIVKTEKLRKRRLLRRLNRSHRIWPYLTRLWHDRHHVGSKAMAPLNAFDIRDQRYAKLWCLWTPLT